MANLDEYLEVVEIGGDTVVRCRECGEDICEADQNYKLHLLQEVRPLAEANPNLVDPAHFVDTELEFRQYYCPGCVRQVTTEISLADRDPVWDKQLSLPSTDE